MQHGTLRHTVNCLLRIGLSRTPQQVAFLISSDDLVSQHYYTPDSGVWFAPSARKHVLLILTREREEKEPCELRGAINKKTTIRGHFHNQ
jgi:hypothetical protein